MLSEMSNDLKKVILAGIGAVAATVEKSEDIVKDLVNKGELTIEQGKALNQELKHKFKESRQQTADNSNCCCRCCCCCRWDLTAVAKCSQP